ncbi:unknown protein [Simkania negevensis Z]|uniref:Uncharacterized protein n=1 Tax=Simkania negevensis (strain ATCC VR-1471 / DSM 27360 / Z) TaxID=331113 RepID=F8L8G2_SIMNZ|nr:unknown protein [Simkania negevensis Z]
MLSKFIDHKRLNIRNMKPLKIGNLRSFGADENRILEAL